MISINFEDYIQELAEQATQQQGIEFSSLGKAEAHVKTNKTKIRSLLQQNRTMFIAGLNHLKNTPNLFVSTVSKKLLKSMHSPQEIAQLLEKKIRKNPHSLEMFSEAVNSYYGNGDFHIEECVIAVLVILFPLEPQPYACLGTLIWRKEGISAAEAFYQSIVDVFESPVLDYFAADCFFKSGNRDQAKQLLHRALEETQKAPEDYVEIQRFLMNLSEKYA